MLMLRTEFKTEYYQIKFKNEEPWAQEKGEGRSSFDMFFLVASWLLLASESWLQVFLDDVHVSCQ